MCVSSVVDTDVTAGIGSVGLWSLTCLILVSFFLRPELKFWTSFSASVRATALGDKLLLAADSVSGGVILLERADVPVMADIGVDVSHLAIRIGDLVEWDDAPKMAEVGVDGSHPLVRIGDRALC